jgi:hypothetical protein
MGVRPKDKTVLGESFSQFSQSKFDALSNGVKIILKFTENARFFCIKRTFYESRLISVLDLSEEI